MNDRSPLQVPAPSQLGLFDKDTSIDALLTPDEIFDRLDEDLLVRLKEDNRIERKPAQFSGDQIGEYISMWANTEPDGGILLIGILDDGRIEGLSRLGTQRINKIEKAPNIYVPSANCKSRRIGATNIRGEDDFVIAIRTPYDRKRLVRNTKGDAYVRIGDEKRKLRPDEARELAAEKGELQFEDEPCGLRFPDDFDLDAIRTFTKNVKASRQWTEEHSDMDVLALKRLGTVTGDLFRPSIGCALLFAKDPRAAAAGCRVRFLRFDGEREGTGEKWNAIKDITVDGTIPEIIEKTDDVIQSQVRTFSHLGPNGRFYTQPEYPRVAWYEAIVNACVHRSYGNGLRNMTIYVKMFDDRLVIESPGPFPPFVTPKNIYDISNPRNPHLMEAMQEMALTKWAHEGTRRMRDTMSEMALPVPEFEESQVGHFGVRVTLRNNVHQRKVWVDRDVTELVGTLLASSLSEAERRFLNFVAEHGEMSVTDAVRLEGCTWGTAKKRLVRLVELGILKSTKRPHKKHDTAARYRLNRPPPE